MAASKKIGARIKVRRVGSPIRREGDQRATLLGLGLKRANQVVELEDTPAVQGMIRKVGHLVEVVK
jgi:large subunit ribosomal protein L30